MPLLRIFSVSVSVSNGTVSSRNWLAIVSSDAVAQLLAVELVERRCADAVTPNDGWPLPAGQRALDEKRAEGIGGPLGGAELLVEAIDEPAGRCRQGHGRRG